MRPTVVVTVLTAILAVGAGVAIAGLPSTSPGADLVVLEVPTNGDRSTPTLPAVTVQPLTTSPSDTSTTEAADGGTTTTSTASTTSSTSTLPPITTTPPATTRPDDDETTNDELRARDAIVVATANATDRNGVAGETAGTLAALGYVDVVPVDADAESPTSTVYHQPGFELEASRLAVELGWGELALAPIAQMPPLQTELQFELVALIGLDQP